MKMPCRIGFYAALCVFLVGTGSAFVPPASVQSQHRCSGLYMTASGRDASPFCRQRSVLYSTPSEDNSSSEMTTSTAEPDADTPPAPKEPEGTQYPIDLPSPLLLGSAMLSAIVSTGMCMTYD